jgi:PAS domain S-box-containing protein
MSRTIAADEVDGGIQPIRDRLSRRALRYIAAVGLIPVLASLARVSDVGWQPVMGLHVGFYLAALGAVAFGVRLPFRARALLLLGALWIVGAAGLVTWGLPGFGSAVLILFIVLTALLFGARAGFAALVVTLATLGILSLLLLTGAMRVGVDAGLYTESWTAWLNAAAALVLVGGLIVSSSDLLFAELMRQLRAVQQTASATRENRCFLDAVLETVGALVLVLDSEGRILRFNRACEALTGYDSREVEGRRVWDFLVPPEECEEVKRVFADLAAGHFPNQHDNDWLTRSGTRRRIMWTNTALVREDGSVSHVIATGIDITERVRAEAALRESEDRVRRSQVYANVGTWDWNIQSGTVYWSERIGPLFGYGREVSETRYENFLKAIHPDDRERVIEHVNACIERDVPYEVEHRVVWPDGTVRWLLERGGVTRAPDGRALRMLGVVQDITERKGAESALAESQQLFREFADHMEQVFWVRDLRADRIIFVNSAYERVWRRGVSLLLENPADFLETVHPDDRETVRKAVAEQRLGKCIDSKYRIIHPDGEVHWMHARPFPIRDSAGRVYRIGGFVEDITAAQEEEAQRAERERRQRAALVREVHHRIKNHLQGVIGLLQHGVDRHPELATTLREAAAQVRSIALVHGLQGQQPAAEVLLCELVPTVARSVEEAMAPRHRIALSMEMGWSLCLADEDAVPVALILNELLVNAVKYTPFMPGGNTLQLTIREEAGVGWVTLFCPGARLPEDFDFERGIGLGTGLDLVKALLPRQGARLVLINQPEGVLCELELRQPVVTAGSRQPTPFTTE